MHIYLNSKYYQCDTDNINDNSLKLNIIRNGAENERYYQNINIGMYSHGGDYGYKGPWSSKQRKVVLQNKPT